MATAATGSQINALTATRAVAAIMVFINHFGGEVYPFSQYPSIFQIGNIAVCYFFVLSGFVLYISYSGKNFSYGGYIRRRIGRIVPVYLLALSLTVCFNVFYNNYNLHSQRSVNEILLSALMLHAYIPTYPLILNLPGWTISVEMFFYILFPLLLLFQKKSIKYFTAFAILLFILSQYLNLKYFPNRYTLPDNIVDTVFFSPEIHISQFLAGMLGGYIFYHFKNTIPQYRSLPLLLFIVIVLLIAFRPANISYQVGLPDPLFLLLIILIARTSPRALNIKPLVFLGEISYGIYILQWPVICYFRMLNDKYIHMPLPYFFYCSLLGLLAIATASYYLLELPLKKKISSIQFFKARHINKK